MRHADPVRIRQTARLQDESASTVLAMICLTSVVSLGALFLEPGAAGQFSGLVKMQYFALTTSTLLASWRLVPTAFACAHLFYRARTPKKPLLFPDQPEEPVYWDFLYFSFTIGVASHPPDVAVGSTEVRRVWCCYNRCLSLISAFWGCRLMSGRVCRGKDQ